MTTAIVTPVLVADAATSPYTTSWDVPLTAAVDAGSALLFAYGAGAANAYLTSISDDFGNPWRIAASAPGGRVSSIGLCEETQRDLRPGDVIHLTATAQMNSARIQVWSVPAHLTMQGFAVQATSDLTPGTEVYLPVPSEAGEFIFAAQVNQSAFTMTGANWLLLGENATTAPVVRSFWQPAAGPEQFLGTLGGSGGWTMCAIRLRGPAAPEPPPPVTPPAEALVPVNWAGLDLNPGYRDDGLCAIVTNVAGWFGTPELEGGNLDRALADGAIRGPKVIKARVITISGAATGPRELCLAYSRQLAALASAKVPSDLTIAEDGLVLTAEVRADSDQMTHEWHGPVLFQYQVVVTATDVRLWSQEWQVAALSFGGGEATGRHYPRSYPWTYGSAALPNTARMVNAGNTPSFAWALYEGPLGPTRLTDGVSDIRVDALADGQQVLINTQTLAATAPGGVMRASLVLPGSMPLIIPPYSEPTWRLYGTGAGRVALQWRAAWT